MQVNSSQDNLAKLEAQIQVLMMENKGLKTNLSDLKTNLSDLKTNNQSLLQKAEWLEIELAISKQNCSLLKHAI